LRFHSANGDAQTTVKINVISVAQSGQQAILNVSQQSLDFGQLQAGQQEQQSVSIANLGNLPLQWQNSLDAGSATWLSLAATKGTVQPGAVPQTLQVKVDTTGLVAGSYSAKIHITSNGGNALVGVALVVTGSTATPSPSPSPTTPTTLPPSPSPTTPTTTPPTWAVSPANLDVTNCSGSSTWTCIVTLTEDANSQVGITWTPSTDQSQVTFSPPGGTLAPGKPVQVTISSIPCSHANFTFSGSGGAQPVTALWNCSPTIVVSPMPLITVAPQNIDPTSSNCSQNSDGTYTCTVTVGETSPGNLNWSAPTGTSVSFNPPSGQLTTSQTQQSVVVSSIPCSNISFTFSDQNKNTATAAWSCTPTPTPKPAVLSANPGSINANTDCTWDTTYAWGCSLTLSNAANAQSSLSWSASSSNLSSYIVGFTPSNGTLNPGQSISVGIIVGTSGHSTCQQGGVNGSLIFTGTTNTVTVPWSCTLPTLSASPTSVNGDTDCTHTTGGSWSCSVTLTQQSPGATYWYASSDNRNVFPELTGGFLGGTGATATVQFTVPGMACPASFNIYFSGGATNITVPWTCTKG